MRIGIVAIIGQLDMPYVKEWLDYHYAIGVNEVWLFMNDWNPIEELKMDKIEGYFGKDRLHLMRHYDGPRMQNAAYNYGMKLANEAGIDWCAFIDIDEFIRVRDKTRTFAEILERHSGLPQLSVNWRLFGSNGIETVEDIYAPDPWYITDRFDVQGRFTKCEKVLNHHVKQIIHLKMYRDNKVDLPQFANPHFTNNWSYSTDGYPVVGPFNETRLDEVHEIELNHYITKSKEECRIRRQYKRADTGFPREGGWEAFFAAHDKNDIYEDQLEYKNQ